MNQARTLDDLAVPPGNRLEPLRGNLAGERKKLKEGIRPASTLRQAV